VITLFSDREIYAAWARRLIFLSSAFLLVPGILRYYPYSSDDFVRVTSTMWGYLYILCLLLMVMLMRILFSGWKKNWRPFSAITLIFISLVLVISYSFINSDRKVNVDFEHGLLPMHIIVTIIAELFFFLSFAGSALYMIMDRQLKKKSSMKLINRLPNLETVERFNLWAIAWSITLLSIGILIGAIMLIIKYGAPSLMSAKEIMMYVSWIMILLICVFRYRKIISPYLINLINIACFAVILITYFMYNYLVRSGFHSFK
jgi:ABC-type uncharacterized transport system permease subunit